MFGEVYCLLTLNPKPHNSKTVDYMFGEVYCLLTLNPKPYNHKTFTLSPLSLDSDLRGARVPHIHLVCEKLFGPLDPSLL